ncbi:hypothetical protein FB451DRAFT_1174346 [Mycena latifolia]|nr:hypothetical protein FB451DRAFT_1174346 [Mycena latifolia]
MAQKCVTPRISKCIMAQDARNNLTVSLSPKPPIEPPPLARPRKFPRSTDLRYCPAFRISIRGSLVLLLHIRPLDTPSFHPKIHGELYLIPRRIFPLDILASDDFPAAVSEGLRRRTTTLAPILFQLVILCIYLRHSTADDAQIYFLTRTYGSNEYQNISADDPMYLAKIGKITRHLMEPEAGSEYVWLDGAIKPHALDLDGEDLKPRPSSPLSEPPIETLPVDPKHSPSPCPPTAQPARVLELLREKKYEPSGPGGPDSVQSGADHAVEDPYCGAVPGDVDRDNLAIVMSS